MSKSKNNKVKDVVSKISLVIYFILCIFSIVFLYNVYKLNVLPFKYLIIVIIVIALYLFLIGLCFSQYSLQKNQFRGKDIYFI